MDQALFESITGCYLDGAPVDSISKNNRITRSVIDHLTRIFNTRTGSIPHLKDYGLPDISEIYRKMPEGIEELKKAIKKTIENYEPRLKNVRVVRLEDDFKGARLVFILSGELKQGGLVRFQTTFTTTGNSTISPWKKPQ
jgi:type VI secretion system protein